MDLKTRLAAIFTLMTAGRAMTLAFVARAGDGGAGDPPAAWLMPLIGDAIVGVAALVIAYLIWQRPSPRTWLVAVVWSAIAIFDAGAAWIVHSSNPWPEFFMIEFAGASMFPAAIVLHLVIAWLLFQPSVRQRFGVDASADASRVTV